MPNIKSSAKRVLIAAERTIRNNRVKSQVKTATRKFEESLKPNATSDPSALFKEAISTIDKAVTKGVLHKNVASRRKARLSKLLNKVS